MNIEKIIENAEYINSYKMEFDESLGDIKPKTLKVYSREEVIEFYKANLTSSKTIPDFNEKYNIWHVFKHPIKSSLRDFPYQLPNRKCPHTMICNIGRGCVHNCPYCYSSAYKWGAPEGIIVYYDNMLDVIKETILRTNLFFKIYISSTIDCYQPIPEIRELTESIFKFLIEIGLPFHITTKNAQVVNLIPYLRTDSNTVFSLQVTLDVPNGNSNLQHLLSPNASPMEKRIDALKQFHDQGIYTTARLDPLIYGLTTDQESILGLLDKISGFTNHIVGSTARLGTIEALRLKEAFKALPNNAELEKIVDQNYIDSSESGNYVNLTREKREKFHRWLLQEVEARGMTYGVCGELDQTFDSKHVKTCTGSTGCFVRRKIKVSSQKRLDTSPISQITQLRENLAFEPIVDCYGDCLRSCPNPDNPPCGNKALREHYPFKPSDAKS
ncbi:MAG: radical SAM protein [Candidatus Hodarchaeota archaeon]